MTPLELVERLTAKGVRLYVEGGDLRYHGPKAVLTPEVLARLKARKAEVIAHLLRTAPETPASKPPKVAPAAVRRVLENPPRFLERVYLKGYRRGRFTLEVLAGGVAAALLLSAHDDGVTGEIMQIMHDLGYGDEGVCAAVWT